MPRTDVTFAAATTTATTSSTTHITYQCILSLSSVFFFAAGLLTQDPRVHERQKPGQYGPRRKYTWYAYLQSLLFNVFQGFSSSYIKCSMWLYRVTR